VATINDVAQAAGVSTATVSRVINHPERVDENTRGMVKTVISKLNYRPNEVARGLASQSSRTIGVVVNWFGSSYYGSMLDGAVAALRQVNFHTIAESSEESADGELRAWDSLLRRQCDALIVHSDFLDDATLAKLMDEHPTAVLMNRSLTSHESRCVYLDNEHGGVVAANYLLANNHTNLAMVTGPENFYESRARARGFTKTLAENGLPEPMVVRGDFLEAGGAQAMEQVLSAKQKITAVFFHNDEMAAGGLQACRQHGVRVPEEMSVFGFDDVDLAHYLTPQLTTVRQPLFDIGHAAAQLAHSLANPPALEDASPTIKRVFEPELVERASVSTQNQ